jgi:uncharacterized protein YktA (UPF0223 family)
MSTAVTPESNQGESEEPTFDNVVELPTALNTSHASEEVPTEEQPVTRAQLSIDANEALRSVVPGSAEERRIIADFQAKKRMTAGAAETVVARHLKAADEADLQERNAA